MSVHTDERDSPLSRAPWSGETVDEKAEDLGLDYMSLAPYYSIRGAAKLLGLRDHSSVYQAYRRGDLEVEEFDRGSGTVALRVTAESLIEWAWGRVKGRRPTHGIPHQPARFPRRRAKPG